RSGAGSPLPDRDHVPARRGRRRSWVGRHDLRTPASLHGGCPAEIVATKVMSGDQVNTASVMIAISLPLLFEIPTYTKTTGPTSSSSPDLLVPNVNPTTDLSCDRITLSAMPSCLSWNALTKSSASWSAGTTALSPSAMALDTSSESARHEAG